MRKGFSLLTALLFMILVATLGALAISLAAQSAKQTSDIFLQQQAELLVQSGTEYALLALSAHDHSIQCLENINATYTPDGTTVLFDINISMRYFGNGLPANCPTPSGIINANNIDTNESNLTVMIDTIVTSRSDISTELIRVHRRTLQKP
ncbi:MAG: type II secretion system protein [Sulfurospirillum sp.]|nr:type II secretion system protein [Sulfurospirillum sp.]